jgi:hypothetical protein
MPTVKAGGEVFREIGAFASVSLSVTKLIRELTVLLRPNINTISPRPAMISEDTVDVSRLRCVLNSINPQLSHLQLRPIKCSDVAVDISIVTERQDLPRLVTKKGMDALSLEV